MLGFYDKRGNVICLRKANKKYESVELREDDEIVGTVAYIAWQPAPKMPEDEAGEDTTRRRRQR